VLQLQEVIQNGLEGNEYVSILSWIMNTYSGAELMQHPELNIDTSSIGPLLNSVEIEKLQQQYLKVICPVQPLVWDLFNSLKPKRM
jgi:exocyst complex component 3